MRSVKSTSLVALAMVFAFGCDDGGGGGVTSTAPAVSGVSPASGASLGGTTLTITGARFDASATVLIGGVAPTGVVVVSNTVITCTSPAHAAGQVAVVVTNPDTQTGTLASGYEFLTTWSIFVYGHADHNLSPSLLADIQEMNDAVMDDHMRVLVVADFSSGRTDSTTGLPFPSGTEWYGIVGNGTDQTLIGTEGEYNFDDPAVLQAAVTVAFSSSPGDKYALILWDHGGSWDGGFGHDEQDTPDTPGDDGSGMSAAQVASAVTAGLTAAGVTGTRPLEFVAFDTCLMCSNEVAHDMRGVAKTYIACAEIDFGNGWDYTTTLGYISANPGATAVTIASQEVSHWDAHHATASQSDTYLRAHAALDLAQVDAYATSWGSLSATMLASSGLDWLEVARLQYIARPGYSLTLDNPDDSPKIRDAGVLLDNLATVTTDVDVQTAAAAARADQTSMMISSSLGTIRAADSQAGIHAEAPVASAWDTSRRASYLALGWDTATDWSGVLDQIVTQSDSVAPVVTTTATNTANPNAANLPTLDLGSADSDVVEAQVLIAETIGANVVLYGLIGSGMIDPGYVYQFTWDGNLFGLSDGTTISEAFVARWITSATASLYALPCTIVDGSTTYPAYAIIEGGNTAVQTVLLDFQGRLMALKLASLRGTQITPQLYNQTSGSWFAATTLTIEDVADPSLTLISASAAAGSYHLLTMITDAWGNTGSALDDVTVVTPFGD